MRKLLHVIKILYILILKFSVNREVSGMITKITFNISEQVSIPVRTGNYGLNAWCRSSDPGK